MTQPADVVAEYDKLVQRAIEVLSDAPCWTHIGEEEYARLEVTKDGARLRWPEDESYYDSTTIERRESICFDPTLLTISADQLKAWKAEQKRLYEARQKAERAAKTKADAAAEEAHEKALFAALKKKYEPAA